MSSEYIKLKLMIIFVILLTILATPVMAQTEMSAGESGLSEPGPVETPAVVFCVLPDFGAQKIFYAPLRVVPSMNASRIDQLSLRFVRAVNAQQQLDLDVRRKACGQSPNKLAASAALRRTLTPLLGQGFVPVQIGIF